MAVKLSALATTAQFETRHGVTSGVDTSLIEQCINAASNFIEKETDRKLKARNYNGFGTAFEHKTSGSGDTVESEDYLYFNGDPDMIGEHGSGVFFLPAYPILKTHASSKSHLNHLHAITFVLEELASRTSAGDTWTALVDNVDYILDQEMGIIRLNGFSQVKGIRNYRITATLGFSDLAAQPYVDEDLTDLCLYIAGKLYREEMDKTSDRQGSSDSTLIALKDDTYVHGIIAKFARY